MLTRSRMCLVDGPADMRDPGYHDRKRRRGGKNIHDVTIHAEQCLARWFSRKPKFLEQRTIRQPNPRTASSLVSFKFTFVFIQSSTHVSLCFSSATYTTIWQYSIHNIKMSVAMLYSPFPFLPFYFFPYNIPFCTFFSCFLQKNFQSFDHHAKRSLL